MSTQYVGFTIFLLYAIMNILFIITRHYLIEIVNTIMLSRNYIILY